MLSESPDKTIITEDWQIFLEKSFQHFIHHKKILKVTKTFLFKIICHARVLDKNIPLWYTVQSPPPPPVLIGLTLKLMYFFSLFSAMTPISFFAKTS